MKFEKEIPYDPKKLIGLSRAYLESEKISEENDPTMREIIDLKIQQEKIADVYEKDPILSHLEKVVPESLFAKDLEMYGRIFKGEEGLEIKKEAVKEYIKETHDFLDKWKQEHGEDHIFISRKNFSTMINHYIIDMETKEKLKRRDLNKKAA